MRDEMLPGGAHALILRRFRALSLSSPRAAFGRSRRPGFHSDEVYCGLTRARGVVCEREKQVPVDMQRRVTDDAALAAFDLRSASQPGGKPIQPVAYCH